VIGNNLVRLYEAACAEGEVAGSDIQQQCDNFIAKRVAATGQQRKTGEGYCAIVKAMISAHLYGVTDEEISSTKAAAKQEAWDNKLQAITPYWEIAKYCGGPGIFLLIPPRSVEV